MALTNSLSRRLVAPLLIIILVVAAGLRFYNLDWDNGIFAHPDERSTLVFYAPTIHWPEDFSTLLDPRVSPLNPFWDVGQQTPRSYTYGHFPLYTLVLVAHGLFNLAPLTADFLPPNWTEFLATAPSPLGFARIGRALMALADLFTVYLIFLLGRRLYGNWGGLLAAALSAFTVLQIQLAHFFAVDPVSTTFTVLALYGALLMYERQTRGAAIITGLGIGLAVASKYSALPVAFAPLLAAFLAARRRGSKVAGQGSDELQTATLKRRSVVELFGLALLALAVAFVVFALTSPFVLLDFENFKHAVVDEQGSMVSGAADFPFTRQYRNTWPYWYFIEQQLRWGMGWPLGLLALAGTLWVAVKAVRGRAKAGEWLILGWIVLYFGPTGLFLAKFMRYMIPVVPLFTLCGAGLVVALWRAGQTVHPPTARSQPDTPPETNEPDGESSALPTQPAEANAPPSNLPTFQPPNPPILHPSPPALLSRIAHISAIAITIIALGGAAFWSLAFVNGVYGTDHTWDTFARWTYANVPDGSCIAREHWDEGVPAMIDGPGGSPLAHHYTQPELPMYEEDTQEKYENLRSTLMNCDYIALASNRLWRTIPGLPQRYPLSSRYYQALFSGDLGFEQAYTVETPPRLGPFVIDDQSADESFTVYDHPKPILFKKTRQLSEAEWDALLGNTWQTAIPGYVGPPTLLMRLRGISNTPQGTVLSSTERTGKSLMLDTPVDQLPVVNDFRSNSLANNSTIVAVLFWWLVVTLIGVLALPLTLLLFNSLPDRGYALSKSLALLLVSYFVWLTSSVGLLSNSVITALIGLIMLAACSLWAIAGRRQQIKRFWREQRSLILASEAAFAVVYLFFIYLRILNPDLWQPWLGGEKMLEIGFLNAVVKSAYMPPYDPFFAGGILNYYYYGLFIVGVLIKLTGIQPTIAFNLAVPTLAALTAANVFSLAGNLSQWSMINGQRSMINDSSPSISHSQFTIHNSQFITSGFLAVLFVVFIGNLEGAAQFMRELGNLSQSGFQSAIPGLQTLVLAVSGLIEALGGTAIAIYNYWDPTRVIPATINEFPYFSFLFADLHPHMIGLPFTILFLSLAYNWLSDLVNQRDNNNGLKSDHNQDLKREDDKETRPEPQLPFLSPHLSFTDSLTRSFADSLTRPFIGSFIRGFTRWLALPFVLGAIAAINTWDLPTYLGLMVATFLLGRYLRERETLTARRGLLLLVSAGIFGGALLAMTYLLYAPFFANYQPPAETGLGLANSRTALDQHLKIWGFFLLIVASWLWFSLLYPASRNSLLRNLSLGLRRWNVGPHLAEIYRGVVRSQADNFAQQILGGIGLVLLISGGLALWGDWVPAYLLPLMILALLLLFRREMTADVAYLGILIFTGLSILLGVEFFYLRDFLGGSEYYRMNTLFKFYIQVWTMFGLVAAVTLPRLWQWSYYWPLPVWLVWRVSLVCLLVACLIYPVLGTRTRLDDRFPGDANRPPIGTLDGLAYMTVGVFEWPAGTPIQLKYDYEAIHWLQDNVPGTPIIAEAKVGYYREGGMRVAAYTGLPSILGGLHQNEQRYSWQVGDRDLVVNEFWSSPDPVRTLQLINELNISYIYDGQIERITHGSFISDKFKKLREQGALELVFENEQTRIYKVVK